MGEIVYIEALNRVFCMSLFVKHLKHRLTDSLTPVKEIVAGGFLSARKFLCGCSETSTLHKIFSLPAWTF